MQKEGTRLERHRYVIRATSRVRNSLPELPPRRSARIFVLLLKSIKDTGRYDGFVPPALPPRDAPEVKELLLKVQYGILIISCF